MKMKSTTNHILTWFCLAVIYKTTSKFIEDPNHTAKLEASCNVPNCEQGCFQGNHKDCFGYIRCVKNVKGNFAYDMPCSFGLIWDKNIRRCNYIEIVHEGCKNDPCRLDNSLIAHRNPADNCVQYYKCEINKDTNIRYSKPQCCLHGEKFENGQCVPNNDPKCVWKCPKIYAPAENFTESANSTTEATDVVKVCLKMEKEGSKGMQYYEDKMLKECSPGTIFNKTECGCINNPDHVRPEGCESEVILKFTRTTTAYSVPNDGYQHAWVGAVEFRESGNKGHFKETSRVYIPQYRDNTNLASHFTLQLVFKHISSSKENQILLSNCKSLQRKGPPIAIMVNNKEGKIYFVADNDTSMGDMNVHIVLPYDKTKENYIYYTYDGLKLTAIVKPLETEHKSQNLYDYKALAKDNEKAVAILSDKKMSLPIGIADLTLGRCDIGDYKSGFSGYMKQFELTTKKGNC